MAAIASWIPKHPRLTVLNKPYTRLEYRPIIFDKIDAQILITHKCMNHYLTTNKFEGVQT